MSEYPIEALMKTTMGNLKDMVDVNTIVGDPVESSDGLVIIPISRVSFGFAAGGAEYNLNKGSKKVEEGGNDNSKIPFGGGSGAGVSVQPVAFIVVGNGQIKMLPVDQGSNALNNLFDLIPQLTSNLQGLLKNKASNKKDNNSNGINNTQANSQIKKENQNQG